MMYLKEQDVKKKKSKQIQELPLSSAIRKRGKRDSRQMWRQGRVLLKQGQCLDNSRNGKINNLQKIVFSSISVAANQIKSDEVFSLLGTDFNEFRPLIFFNPLI